MADEKIVGNRVYLRKLSLDDASEEYCRWLNDPEVNKYLETREATIEDLKAYIKMKRESKDTLFMGIFLKENDKHIGNLKLEPIDFEEKKATFSILLGDKNEWGKGIGSEATELIVRYAFNELGLNKVDLGVISENTKAIRSYEKVGFKIIGRVPKCLDHDGIKYDKIIMEITK